MDKDEALKLALKFVEDSECETADLEAHIKEALAEPEKEPVAWMVYTREGKYAFVTDNPAQIHPSQRALPLYATPQWVGLTDEERHQAVRVFLSYYRDFKITDAFVMRIEMLLKEKNT